MKEEKTENLNLGVMILIASLIISYGLYAGLSNREKAIERISIPESYLPMPPCEPWDGGDYWCKPYVDWGYANGLVMPKRILSENNFVREIENYSRKEKGLVLNNELLKTCDEIVNELYESNSPKASGDYPFRTKK